MSLSHNVVKTIFILLFYITCDLSDQQQSNTGWFRFRGQIIFSLILEITTIIHLFICRYIFRPMKIFNQWLKWDCIKTVFNTCMAIIYQWYVSHPVFCGYLWSPIKWPSVERQASLDRQSVTEGVVCVLWVSSRLILITRKSWVTSW